MNIQRGPRGVWEYSSLCLSALGRVLPFGQPWAQGVADVQQANSMQGPDRLKTPLKIGIRGSTAIQLILRFSKAIPKACLLHKLNQNLLWP